MRIIVGVAALAMAVVEAWAIFVESPYAVILAFLFVVGAVWLWLRRESVWPVVALAVLFGLEILYLSDYNWNESMDRVVLILTGAICGAGLLAALAWLVQRRRTPTSTQPAASTPTSRASQSQLDDNGLRHAP